MPGAVLSPGDLAANTLGACSHGLYILLEESEGKKQTISKKMVAIWKCYKEH